MSDDSHWDPEMRAAFAAAEARAAQFPPVRLSPPFDLHRAINEEISLPLAQGGPVMASTEDRWVLSRGRRVLCRVHIPTAGSRLPVLIYLHGGGWVWSSVDTHDRIMRECAAASGCAVVGVDYALSPEARFPQAVEECAGIVRWLAERGQEWDLDGSRLAVAGDSAGANLALATALMLRDTGGPSLRGLVAFYPVCDSNFATPSYREFGGGGYLLTEEKMRAFWSAYTRDNADRLNPLAAPLRANLSDLPPVLIQLAELDVLRSEGEEMAARLHAAGVGVEMDIYRGLIHGFARNAGQVAQVRTAINRVGEWLQRVVG